MKSIWNSGLPVVIAFLVALLTVPAVAATTELTAIDPPEPNTPNVIGLSTKTIDRLIERIDSSESFAASSAKKQNTLAELQRIKTVFPNVTLAEVQLIDDTLATLNKEFRVKKYSEKSGSNEENAPKWGYYYEVPDVSTSAENLGNYINASVDRIDEIMLQDSAWQSNTELITMTKGYLTQAIRYSQGYCWVCCINEEKRNC